MQRVRMESGRRCGYCLKIKVNAEFLSLDLLFLFSLKKSAGNSQGLIHLSNYSVSWAIMYKERKCMTPYFPIFMSKFLNIRHLRNYLYFQFQQNKTTSQLIMTFLP